MGDDTLQLLRHYELRLLRCTLPSLSSTLHHYPPPPSDQSLHLLIDGVLSSIESGRCVEALSLGQELFNGVNLVELVNPNEFYAEIESSVEVFLRKSGDFEMYFRVFVVVSIAVAAFLAFIQTNMIGPVIELPSTPLPWIRIKGGPEWEAWARNELMSVGSDLLGKFSNLQFIIFAKILLTRTRDLLFQEGVLSVGGISSITWWMARVTLLQQRLLHECCSSLFDLLQVFIGQSLHALGNVEKVTSYWGAMLHEDEALNIVSMLHLEAGLIDYTFGRVDSSRKYFESAASVSGLELSLSGALGFRTVHQVEPKAQMVLVARKSSSDSVTTSPLTNPSLTISAVSNEENSSQNIHGIGSASDVLMTPRLSENSFNGSNGASIIQNGRTTDVNLNANQQAAVLAQCVLLEKSARQDELQRWEMAPYIEAVDSQKMSYFIIRCFCNILRVRWESTRDRTKERALLMMDKVVQDLYEPCPEVHGRIRSCFAVYIPTMPALRKEYGELLVSRGLIGEAVKTFEDLELWDNLIYCYRLLEKKAAAVELIKTRLSERPNDPRLWCSLGDVTNDDSCYEKALKVSNDKSARAKRSLARSAYNRGDYEKSKILWESAMALNSLYPDGWFALGAAALKARDIEKALDGFTRAVQLDPENGEAWNNIACLHMIRNKSKEAFIAFKEALKFKRDSWQMWENYSHVAVDIGNLTQAMEALQMVLDLSKNKRVDEQLLGRIMQEMEKRISDSELASTRETVNLMELLGKILRQIVRSSGGGEIWGLYARWLKNKGDLTMYSEALLKQVRSYQGSELWKDVTRFKKFANASLELCKVYMEISSSSGGIKELHAAQMHLRNTLKQANSFSDTEEFKALQDCLDQVKMRLEGYSAAATQHSLETLSL